MTFRPQPKPVPTPKKKRTRIKAVSVKREQELKVYSKLRKKHLDRNPICAVCKSKPATEVHHKLHLRYGRFLNMEEYFLSVDRECHNWLHENHNLAIQNGFMIGPEEKHKLLREEL